MSTIEEKKKEIKAEVADLESDLDVRINQLKVRVAETLSVTEWVKKYPLESVGVAALVGFLIAYQNDESKGGVKGVLIAEVKRQVTKRVLQKVSEQFLGE